MITLSSDNATRWYYFVNSLQMAFQPESSGLAARFKRLSGPNDKAVMLASS